MEFFNCKAGFKYSGGDYIKSVDVSKLLATSGERKTRDILNSLVLNCQPFCIENLDFASIDTLKEVLNYLPIFSRLVGNGSNHLAGARGSGKGLTSFGEKVVLWLKRSGTIVDVSGLSESAFREVLIASKTNVICTDAVLPSIISPYSLTDSEVEALINSGSLISLSIDIQPNEYLGTSIFNHIKKYGVKNLALNTAKPNFKKLRALKDYLKTIGVREFDVERIFYLNAKNFFDMHMKLSLGYNMLAI